MRPFASPGQRNRRRAVGRGKTCRHDRRATNGLKLTRSNVSNHLACLRGCGLVVATPQGRQMRYELVDGHLAHALGDLVDVALAVDTAQPCVDGHGVTAAP